MVALVVLAAIGACRIAETYTVFSQTFDEPAHVAGGMEWLDEGTYTIESLHVPLARVAAAIGPYVDGLRFHGKPSMVNPPDMWAEGNRILYERGTYKRNLALARLGILPFFLVATLIVWLWARWLFGDAAAVLATALFTTLPAILANSGIATTDMAFTATLAAALFSFARWLDRPTRKRAVVFGIAAGFAAISKLSFILFLPASAASFVLVRWLAARRHPEALVRRPTPGWGKQGALAVLCAAFVVWGAYRFDVGPMAEPGEVLPEQAIDRVFGSTGKMHDLAMYIAQKPIYPAPPFIRGVASLAIFNQEGRVAYVLGERYYGGRWYYFPVAIGVKTPIAFLILVGLGIVAAARYRREAAWRALDPAAAAAALLLLVMTLGGINIGLRHILPIYPLLAILAGAGALLLWRLPRPKHVGPVLGAMLVGWQVISSARAHPDYLSYYNEIGNRRPEYYLLGSDLDWGQDLNRLADTLEARKVPELSIAYWGTADLQRHGLPPLRRLERFKPVTGWVAVSVQGLYGNPGYEWLRAHTPVARIGKSMLLYYIPDGAEEAGDQIGAGSGRRLIAVSQ